MQCEAEASGEFFSTLESETDACLTWPIAEQVCLRGRAARGFPQIEKNKQTTIYWPMKASSPLSRANEVYAVDLNHKSEAHHDAGYNLWH